MLEILFFLVIFTGAASVLLFMRHHHIQREEWLKARNPDEEAFIQTVIRNSMHLPATEGRGAYEFSPHHFNREEAVRFVRMEWPQIQAKLRAKAARNKK